VTLSIVDFLNARLDEDQAAAENASQDPDEGNVWSVGARQGTWKQEARIGDDREDLVFDIKDGVCVGFDDLLAYLVRFHPARVLREVEAKRAILKHEVPIDHAEWKLSGSESWFLSGPRFFAECWSDSTVNAWISDVPDGPTLDTTGVVSKDNLAGCQAFAESWIREQLSKRSPVVRALAAVYSGHPDYREEWKP
jgi:hypothetical protein